MSINFSLGSLSLTQVDNLTDLKNTVATYLKIGEELEGKHDFTLASLPVELRTTSIGYSSGNQCWNLGEFGFTLSGGVCGKLSVCMAGDELFKYAKKFDTELVIGLDTKKASDCDASIKVPDGAAYVCLELDFNIQGGISATYSQGVYGVSGSVNSTDTFSVAFYKKCGPSDKLGPAIASAFSDFVLPLHAQTLSNLKLGDYLHHNFNGNLQVGLGASIGVDKVLYAGQYKADIPDTGGAVGIKLSAQPEFQAGAKLAFNFEYDGTFEALLWKDAANSGHLQLHRSRKQDVCLGVTAGITLIAAPTASAVVNSQLQDCFKGVLSGPVGDAFNKEVWPKAASEVSQCVDDVNSKICGWLNHVQQTQSTLAVAIDRSDETVLLLEYGFNLSAPAYGNAWLKAIGGKFVEALELPNGGVSIATGGGLENFYDDKTSVKLNLFGKLNAAWTDDVISNSSLIYAGNGTFHLVADVGRRSLFQLNKSKREVDIYFGAELDLKSGSNALGPINLHLTLMASDNPSFGRYIAGFIHLMTTGADGTALANAVSLMAARKQTTQLLHVVLGPKRYGSLTSSSIVKGKPDDPTKDEGNFAAFGLACAELKLSDVIDFGSLSYTLWSDWNIASNDQWPAPAGAIPNRRDRGDQANGVAFLRGNLGGDAGKDLTAVAYSLQAASDFMNFCDDLRNLALLAAVDAKLDTWDKFVDELKSIMENDVSQDFIAPTGLALTRLCAGGAPDLVKGPAPDLTDKNSIAVTMTYA